MVFEDFKSCHVDQAVELIKRGYGSQREKMGFLPEFDGIFDKRGELEFFAEKNLGVAAVDDGKLVGFVCAYPAFSGAFNSPTASSCWSPVHAHGLAENVGKSVWPILVQKGMEKWKKIGANMFLMTLFSSETDLSSIIWNYGFGKRCEDAARVSESICAPLLPGFSIGQLDSSHFPELRKLRRELADHLEKSPCMFISPEEAFENHLKSKESNQNLTTFGLFDSDGNVSGFIDLEDDSENFVSCSESFLNICGMYVKPEFRGKNLAVCLLDAALDFARDQGYPILGVDYETMNPTAKAFWGKHFEPYTVSFMRRLP